MKSDLYGIIVILCLLPLSAWKLTNNLYIQKAEWLLGTWENKTSRGSVFETWTKLSANEMFGMSYTINGKDTIFFEDIQMIQDNDSLFYIPTVKNQNNGIPIQFALDSMTDSSMIFKHPYHDFPQIIRYLRINQDSLEATISGIQNGQERSIVFPMKRIH